MEEKIARRASIFIGSSTEGHDIAEAIQLNLRDHNVEIWSQGVFGQTVGGLESLVGCLDRFDFAIIVLSADDLLTTRGLAKQVPRDNVLLELGLFLGRIGRERTFAVYDESNPPALPSDLAGVTFAKYRPYSPQPLLPAALGPACTLIKTAIREHKPFPRIEYLERRSSKDVKARMRAMCHSVLSSDEGFLDAAAIAHKSFFETDEELNRLLSQIVDKPRTLKDRPTVRLLFLNPDSKPAIERAGHEETRVNTRGTIRSSLGVARSFLEKHSDRLHIRLSNEPLSCFLFTNNESTLFHPYLNSVSGNETEVFTIPSHCQMYGDCRGHFVKLWEAAKTNVTEHDLERYIDP